MSYGGSPDDRSHVAQGLAKRFKSAKKTKAKAKPKLPYAEKYCDDQFTSKNQFVAQLSKSNLRVTHSELGAQMARNGHAGLKLSGLHQCDAEIFDSRHKIVFVNGDEAHSVLHFSGELRKTPQITRKTRPS